MSKKLSHNEMAEEIVKKFATFTVEKHEAIDEYDEDKTVHSCTIVDQPIALILTTHGTSKKDAREQMVEQVTEQLESGNLQLSDTWAEDNLKSKKSK